MATKFLKVFRAGTHTTMFGNSICFSRQDVADTATFYRLGRLAPLVLGHPVNDMPALGMVTNLVEKNGELFAEVDSSDTLTNLVRANKVNGVSCKFWPKVDSENPVPGIWSLKHLGFLTGDQQPGVKGLGAVQFEESRYPAGAYGGIVPPSFVDLGDIHGEVSFSEGLTGRARYQADREALHQAALRTVAAHPEFSYIEAVRMFERAY